jgi:hypothetical protein
LLGNLRSMKSEINKISFAVISMNRLHQLKQTLIKNIEDNICYPDIEFLVLNYNSKDGMDEWVYNNLSTYIRSGKVVYYKTVQPKQWSPSHSKNLAFRLASGDVICNIWADYFAGKNFAEFVNHSFCADSNIVLTPICLHKSRSSYSPASDLLGKVCVRKEDFMKIHGFDERINKHGFEDYDFINRLEFLGVKRMMIEGENFSRYIPHNDSERFVLPTIDALYVHHVSPCMSDYLLLFKDGTFETARIVDLYSENSSNYRNATMRDRPYFRFRLQNEGERGNWLGNDGNIVLDYGRSVRIAYVNAQKSFENTSISLEKKVFHSIICNKTIEELLKFRHFYDTRKIMEENLTKKRMVVNLSGFGIDRVFKNFESQSIDILT